MVVVTRVLDEIGGLGSNVFAKVTVELMPEEQQQMCRESMATSTAPTWDKDKTYF